MVSVGGSDETVIGSIHQVPDPLDIARLFIDELLWGHSGLSGTLFDFLAMLIGTGHEVDIITVSFLVSGDGISHDDLIGVADVRLAAGIGNGCRDVVFSLVAHVHSPFEKKVPLKDVL